MNSALTQKQMSLAIACALSLTLAANVASAQNNPGKTGYLLDQRGEVVKSGYGLCWHTSSWTPELAIAECEPDLMPKQVAAAPAAARTPVPGPTPAAQKVKLDADTLFDFNKAVLRPEGKRALDEFLVQMKGINPEVIIAVGHADRFGTDSYNQRLSERRAAAVKTYLLAQGIAENRVFTEGKGELQPVTKAGECTGAKSKSVIACLQPDRRVEIEVVGTRIAR